jgi:hypothetical protein
MSELELWLRDHLDEAIPRTLDASGLMEGAHRYARRVRRIRIAVVACVVAALVGVGGAVASGSIRDRALTPARHVSHLACGQSPATMAANMRATLADGSLPLSQQLREVLVCADRSSRSVWQGFLPPDEPVSLPGSLDYLSFKATQSQPCPVMPAGPSYRFLLLDLTGQVTAVDNRSLACNGWPALNRYFIALGDQMSAERAVQLPDPFPKCTSMLHATLRTSTPGPAALPKGTVFTQATICWHPLADPKATPAKAVAPIGREVFSIGKLAILNAAVARHGSSKTRVTCVHDPSGVVVVHAVTTTGRQISLTSPCVTPNPSYVNGAEDDTITFPVSTLTALTQ